jgi:hypothetical protein
MHCAVIFKLLRNDDINMRRVTPEHCESDKNGRGVNQYTRREREKRQGSASAAGP